MVHFACITNILAMLGRFHGHWTSKIIGTKRTVPTGIKHQSSVLVFPIISSWFPTVKSLGIFARRNNVVHIIY